MADREEIKLLCRIARMYYIDDMTQSEISTNLGIHRTAISKLLKKAREEGIVTIRIKDDLDECVELEGVLEKTFNLKQAIVLNSYPGQTESAIEESLGLAGAEFMKKILKDGDVIGFAWGRMMAALSNQLYDCKRVYANIVPLVGGPSNLDNKYHVNTIVSKVSTAFGSKAHYLYAPAITYEKKTKDAIMEDKNLKDTLELWEKINKVFVGIGSRSKSNNLIWNGSFKNSETEILDKAGAVGDVCSRFFGINGSLVDDELKDRIIAIDPEKLKNMEYSIGIAESYEKVPSILGAIQGKFINVLITDERTAKLLLELDKQLKGGVNNVAENIKKK